MNSNNQEPKPCTLLYCCYGKQPEGHMQQTKPTNTNVATKGGGNLSTPSTELAVEIRHQLSRAYYNGLANKGWSLHDETEAVAAIASLVAEAERKAVLKGKLHTIQQIRVITTSPILRETPDQLLELLDGLLDDYEAALKEDE